MSSFAPSSRLTLEKTGIFYAARHAAFQQQTRHLTSCSCRRFSTTKSVGMPEAMVQTQPTYATSSTSSTTPSGTEPAVMQRTSALSLLSTQSTNLYALVSIVGRTLLLSPSDVVTLPRLSDVIPGDILHLNRVHEIGSRDYTLRAQSNLSTRVVKNPLGNAASPAARDARSIRKVCRKSSAKMEMNPTLRAYAAAIPGGLAERSLVANGSNDLILDQQQYESLRSPDNESHVIREIETTSGFNHQNSPTLLQVALQQRLRQSTSSFGALVSSHGGLAHKGAVLPALVGPSSGLSSNTASAEPMVQVELTVLEHTKGPLERITKTKRRKGYKRTVQHKQTYTRLRVDAIRIVGV